MLIHKDMMEMFEQGSFDVRHIEPWLRGFVRRDERH
jgi:death-on-curing protein